MTDSKKRNWCSHRKKTKRLTVEDKAVPRLLYPSAAAAAVAELWAVLVAVLLTVAEP
jgi:hypothetical protein